jgi:hypothetical protein
MARSEPLPQDYRTRWGPARKARVVYAVNTGFLKLEDALALYRLSLEEFQSWQRALAVKGAAGLRATHGRAKAFGRKGLRRMLDRSKSDSELIPRPV